MNNLWSRMLNALADDPFYKAMNRGNQSFRGPTPAKRGHPHRGYTKPMHNEAKARQLRLMQKASRKANRK